MTNYNQELEINKQLYDLGLIDHVEYVVKKQKIQSIIKTLRSC